MWQCQHDAETRIPPDRIWQLWEDVAGWSRWNPGVAAARLNGPFSAGSTIAMTLPDHEVVTLTLDTVDDHARFIDEATFNGLTLRTDHRIEPPDSSGAYRVVYALVVTGDAPPEVLAEVGHAVSADFPDVLASLLATAQTDPRR